MIDETYTKRFIQRMQATAVFSKCVRQTIFKPSIPLISQTEPLSPKLREPELGVKEKTVMSYVCVYTDYIHIFSKSINQS